MTGTSLMVPTGNSIVGINPMQFDRASAQAAFDAYKRATQFTRTFPGKSHEFKKGKYVIGYGPTAEKSLTLEGYVFNVPNLVETWRYFVPTGNGKSRPEYLPVAYAALAQRRRDREGLGASLGLPELDDENTWKAPLDPKTGKPQIDTKTGLVKRMDPFSALTGLPIRKSNGVDIDHFLASSTTAHNALRGLFISWFEQSEGKDGYLPVVKGTIKEVKQKDSGTTFEVPVFTIVDWVKAIEADNPGAGQPAVEDLPLGDDDGDDGIDDAQMRDVTPKAGVPSQRPTFAKPANLRKTDAQDI